MSRGHGCVLNSSAVFSPIWREQIIALQRLCSAYRKTVSLLVFLPLLKFLDILTVENVFRFFVLKLTYQWHKAELPDVFHEFFRYASSVHAYNTRYAVKNNL